MSTVASPDQAAGAWSGLESDGFTAATVSMLNGPRWTGLLQFPELSPVRRWNHHCPSASGGLVDPVAVSSASLTVSGTVVGLCDHPYEKPSTPLPESEAPLHVTSTVLSFDQPGTGVLDSVGFTSGASGSFPPPVGRWSHLGTNRPGLNCWSIRITWLRLVVGLSKIGPPA